MLFFFGGVLFGGWCWVWFALIMATIWLYGLYHRQSLGNLFKDPENESAGVPFASRVLYVFVCLGQGDNFITMEVLGVVDGWFQVNLNQGLQPIAPQAETPSTKP